MNIFKSKPEQWGLRGDPLFWDELEATFDSAKIRTEADLVAFIKAAHKRLTGEEITPQSVEFCEAFSTDTGASDGCIDGEWWHNTAIPLLTERLKG